MNNIVPTFFANIYLGLNEGYTGKKSKLNIESYCKGYCGVIKLGVTVTKTTFCYPDGMEDGVIIGLINYPRFPSTPEEIEQKAIELAKCLKNICKQERVTIVMPNHTIMLGNL